MSSLTVQITFLQSFLTRPASRQLQVASKKPRGAKHLSEPLKGLSNSDVHQNHRKIWNSDSYQVGVLLYQCGVRNKNLYFTNIPHDPKALEMTN